jgi:hypothetical protein
VSKDAAQQLQSRLRAVQKQSPAQSGTKLHVPGVGSSISIAYEQLRIAAEYTEDHLLLERAIRRFLIRNVAFHHQRNLGEIGEELVIELTQAGYLKNSSISVDTTVAMTNYVTSYMAAYRLIRKNHVPTEIARGWILDVLSVGTTELLNPKPELSVFTYFAYEHYLELLPKGELITDPLDANRYEISLYVAVHRALLKSDLATIRYDLVRLYGHSPDRLAEFIQFNLDITDVFYSKLTQRLRRAVSKYGAPLRVLQRMLEDNPGIVDVLTDRRSFLAMYEQQTYTEYRGVRERLNRGLIKSIVFLLITKGVVGFGVEVPYDLATAGSVAVLPLGVNLLFPPIYMATLRLGFRLPSIPNAQALQDYIDKVMYSEELPLKPSLRSITRSMSVGARLLYTIVFLVPFAITVFVLVLLHFTLVQMIIFFIFLSAASFLGFRLSQTIRELEIVVQEVGFLAAMRDVFYLPFIVVGQWLSSKYARANIVGLFLDIIIEMPLKTVLRLIRQWLRFLNDRREQIY